MGKSFNSIREAVERGANRGYINHQATCEVRPVRGDHGNLENKRRPERDDYCTVMVTNSGALNPALRYYHHPPTTVQC